MLVCKRNSDGQPHSIRGVLEVFFITILTQWMMLKIKDRRNLTIFIKKTAFFKYNPCTLLKHKLQFLIHTINQIQILFGLTSHHLAGHDICAVQL